MENGDTNNSANKEILQDRTNLSIPQHVNNENDLKHMKAAVSLYLYRFYNE